MINKDWFERRFVGKKVGKKLELVKMAAQKPKEVVAVTGATVSSQAVVKGVNRALHNYQQITGDE